MPWTYEQSTGLLTDPAGVQLGLGYSGCGAGYNNPAAQDVENVGPIPAGNWSIRAAFTHALAGPVTMRLLPMPDTATFGRDGFMIHGDTVAHARDPTPANSASEGCIVLALTIREAIAASDDRVLLVTT